MTGTLVGATIAAAVRSKNKGGQANEVAGSMELYGAKMRVHTK
jgi:hypothetical protein